MAEQKSAAQVLFEKIVRTWIAPEAKKRAQKVGHPIVLRIALIIWDRGKSPSIFFNDEVTGKVMELKVDTTGPVKSGQPITASDIKGLRRVSLYSTLRKFPFIFVIQGAQERYYLRSDKMASIVDTREFELLEKSLATGGVQLTSQHATFDVYLDVIRHGYDGLSPAQKRKHSLQSARLEIERVEREATKRVKRHLKLPTLIAHNDDEFLLLLREARRTYIDGYFFSCIAAGVTTADRICNRLVQRYELPEREQRSIFAQTFGQKIQRLHANGILNDLLKDQLEQMNTIRNKHLHPKKPFSALSTSRDALKIIRLLHEVLEGTFSVYRDYTIQNGSFIPKSLV